MAERFAVCKRPLRGCEEGFFSGLIRTGLSWVFPGAES